MTLKYIFKNCFSLLSVLIFTNCSTQKNTASIPVSVATFDSKQIIVVVTPTATAQSGLLRAYEWSASKAWQPLTNWTKVKLGRNGMAWGAGLQQENMMDTLRKKEGDGKAPQGIFRVTHAFGYAEKPNPKWRMLYLNTNSNLLCIDDSKSKYYNQIVAKKAQQDWDSSEQMRREDGLYEYGLLVDYNKLTVAQTPETAATKQGGSCIFMHIQKPNDLPTAGCTAMSRTDIVGLIGVLDATKKPILVQATSENYTKMMKIYGLPNILETK